MATAADGYIRIDTKIDQAGAKNGLSSLTKSLKGFAIAVGIAFGVAAVLGFGKSCIGLASDLNEVQNVVQTTFGESTPLIEDFADTAITSFGLSELAAKRYTGTMGAMLKSMGFGQDAAADMSIQMASLAGDMASFYNLSTDEAFQKIRSGISGETEPLKQLGVNLSVANLEQYAFAQGIRTSYAALSEKNKALLRYNYLLDVTKDAQGDFAKTSDSWANQVRVLKLQLDSLKATLGQAFIVALTPVLQMVNRIIGGLSAAATIFANFIGAVTGTSQSVTTFAGDAAAAVDGLTDSTEASGAAAKKAAKGLARFDELNVMGAGGGAAGGPAVETTQTAGPGEATNKAFEDTETRMQQFFGKYHVEVQRIRDSWARLKGTVLGFFAELSAQFKDVDLGGAAFSALASWVYTATTYINLLIASIGDLILAFNIPATAESALRLISEAGQTLGDIFTAITPGVLAFVDIALVPIAEWVGGKVRDAFAFFVEQLDKVGAWFLANQDKFTELGTRIGEITKALWDILVPIADAAWATAKDTIAAIVDGLLDFGTWCLDNQKTIETIAAVVGSFGAAWWLVNGAIALYNFIGVIATAVMGGMSAAGTILAGVIAAISWPVVLAVAIIGALIAVGVLLVLNWDWVKAKAAEVWTAIAEFFAAVWKTITETFDAAWAGIKTGALGAWEGIKSAWSAVTSWFKTWVIQPLTDAFEAFKDAFARIWDGIWGALKNTINLILGGVEFLVNGVVKGVNKIIDGLNTIVDAAGKVIGMKATIPRLPTLSLPRLAQGAVIPPNREFLAVLGDQRRGTNIETPLATMIEAFKAALAEMGGGTGGDILVEILFNGTLARVGEVLEPVITAERRRKGPNAVKIGGAVYGQ